MQGRIFLGSVFLRIMVRPGVLIPGCLAIFIAPCSAQMSATSLGGYSGSILDTRSEFGSTATLIPYGGTFSGFMPYRMGGGRTLTFESRGQAVMDVGRTPFRLSPGLFDSGLGGNSSISVPRNRPLPGAVGIMPPNFGSPFRRPSSLISPGTAGGGPSM